MNIIRRSITLYSMLFDGIINFITFMLTIYFFKKKNHIHTNIKLIYIPIQNSYQ